MDQQLDLLHQNIELLGQNSCGLHKNVDLLDQKADAEAANRIQKVVLWDRRATFWSRD